MKQTVFDKDGQKLMWYEMVEIVVYEQILIDR